jgi:hypothetical protein
MGRETHAPLNPVAFVRTYGYASDAASLGEAVEVGRNRKAYTQASPGLSGEKSGS